MTKADVDWIIVQIRFEICILLLQSNSIK